MVAGFLQPFQVVGSLQNISPIYKMLVPESGKNCECDFQRVLDCFFPFQSSKLYLKYMYIMVNHIPLH